MLSETVPLFASGVLTVACSAVGVARFPFLLKKDRKRKRTKDRGQVLVFGWITLRFFVTSFLRMTQIN